MFRDCKGVPKDPLLSQSESVDMGIPTYYYGCIVYETPVLGFSQYVSVFMVNVRYEMRTRPDDPGAFRDSKACRYMYR